MVKQHNFSLCNTNIYKTRKPCRQHFRYFTTFRHETSLFYLPGDALCICVTKFFSLVLLESYVSNANCPFVIDEYLRFRDCCMSVLFKNNARAELNVQWTENFLYCKRLPGPSAA